MATKKPWADLLDGPGKPGYKGTSREPAQPDVPPTTVHMHTISDNPENPRTEADYTDDDPDFRDLKASMKAVGQLQPAVALSRDAFLTVKPECAAQIGDKQWVVILGNRRLHAARQLGWTKFEIRVRDRLGNQDDDKIDEAVVIENIHRKNIPPYREAVFLQRMLERHGSQDKVAERIGKSQMYVSNRLALLDLAPELREAVDTKQIKVKTAEKIAKIPDHEKQKAYAAEEARKAAQPKPPRSQRSASTKTSLQNPVLKTEAHKGGGAQSTSAPAAQAPPIPVQVPGTTARTSTVPPRGVALMDAAFEELNADQRSAFILHYFQRSTGVDAVIADMRGELDLAARESLARILQQVADGLLRDA
ncbi:ParB/RepB/Spo0J family partition protein [Streptomyces sp. NPDC002248]